MNFLIDKSYPIKPFHIDPDRLFSLAAGIVRLCQTRGHWSPFTPQDVGATGYQLKQIGGLLHEDGLFFVGHEFIVSTLFFAPSFSVREKDMRQLIIRSHIFTKKREFQFVWEELGDLQMIFAWLITSILSSLISRQSLYFELSGWIFTNAWLLPVWLLLMICFFTIATFIRKRHFIGPVQLKKGRVKCIR